MVFVGTLGLVLDRTKIKFICLCFWGFVCFSWNYFSAGSFRSQGCACILQLIAFSFEGLHAFPIVEALAERSGAGVGVALGPLILTMTA